jgi:hypothetical protein
MKHTARLAIVATAVALLSSSCAILNSPDARKQQQARIAIEGATVALIEYKNKTPEAKAAKAARVLEYTNAARTLIGSDPETTVVKLREALTLRAAERDLSPGQKLIALEAINTICDEVELRVGKGVLSAEAVVSVNKVLGWVETVAKLYATD